VTPQPKGNQAKILIVDDNERMRAFVREALQSLPVMVLEAEDGMEAMNVIERENPALLVMDYQMPAWDGLEVCRQIRKQPGLKDIKVLMVTGHIIERELLQAVNFRLVDAALSKPVNPAELKQLTRHLLGLETSAYAP
jgi:two-component system phosphate regulon response regulator PhoB